MTTTGANARAIAAGSTTAGARVLARHPHPSETTLATALAHAFLAADAWNRSAVIESAVSVLGVRRRWLGPLATEILRIYHRPPTDSPRELTSIIARCAPFLSAVDAAARRGVPIRIQRHRVVPTQAQTRDERVHLISTLAELSTLLDLSLGELDWFADTKKWNRRAAPGHLHHYRYEWRRRSGRVPRLFEVPQSRMRAVQRTVLASILSAVPTHDAAHGFVPGRSAITGAQQHTGSRVVIALDLVTFFARVTARRVYSTLRQVGYPEAVAHSLAGLCTNAVPHRVLSAMPPGGTPEARFALRQALATAHLPQGAPTSPMLANLAVRRLDSRLEGWATHSGATYTRYADDLAFSGDALLLTRADAFVRGVQRIVLAEGHQLNALKTRVRKRSVRQTVTGIVVNERTNVTRTEFDRLSATLHNCVLHGPASQNREKHADFRAHLLGRITWVESLNPGRSARLRGEFARIRW